MSSRLEQRLKRIEQCMKSAGMNDAPSTHVFIPSRAGEPEHWLQPWGAPPEGSERPVFVFPDNGRDLSPENRPETMPQADWLAYARAHGNRWAEQ